MNMKIGRVGSVRSGVTRRAKGKGGGGTGGFEVGSPANEPSVAPVSNTGATTSVGALLAVQEVSDATDEKKQGFARGRDLLQELEEIRLGLLLGAVPRVRLERLMRMLEARRGAYSDAKLNEIISEIEVRAAVELAKFESTGFGKS
jgi:hypothetical protein